MRKNKSGKSKENPIPNEGTKVLSFKVGAFLLPIAFLIILELILRWSGYGVDYVLFKKAEDRPGHLVMNPEIGKKYLEMHKVKKYK